MISGSISCCTPGGRNPIFQQMNKDLFSHRSIRNPIGNAWHARIQWWGTGDPDPPPWKITEIGALSNTGPDPLKKHKATKPAFNDGPSTARQRSDDAPHQLKTHKKIVKLTKLSGSAHALCTTIIFGWVNFAIISNAPCIVSNGVSSVHIYAA